ncbi:aspartyl-phosphate phosphatase Spo0E family protein [Alkalihalobacillus sp. BA299]|uniref:aspartyl-phosphate phosphatase Spo0E family protein n=1 Tax=Alkalihalobacillus sp. BA299 TaxID=2815938 RepID=UPI001AD9DA76|nr:aspartyl-phosphate phosphatase Spo0E family protein [Alkalihalobacillus sp. BA299]
MLTTVERLKEEIEQKKMEMISTAENKGMTSLETLHCSQELDKLIYKFQKIALKNR